MGSFRRRLSEMQMAEHAFDLKSAFLLRQEQLLATLGAGRSAGSHPVAIGDDSELNWRGMLRSILPARYGVSKGFAVDADGRRSQQIDVLIHDRFYSPTLLDIGDHVFVPAEAVYAVLEVKQEMTLDHIVYAARKVASVRRLRRTSGPVPFVSGALEPKTPQDILGGLLALDTKWKPPFGRTFVRAIKSASVEAPLDIGCTLRCGAYELGENEQRVSAADTTLIFFALSLLRRLQAMASVPAIQYEEYGRVLEAGGADAEGSAPDVMTR
ncbi:MAG: hypothetical protein IH958_06790 [Chloroflexi bacterium]|nr:hypothetical protein [Chloroflexota bacterium]